MKDYFSSHYVFKNAVDQLSKNTVVFFSYIFYVYL